MLELFQKCAHKNQYKKMYISEHDSDYGARIGGNPPEGVVPDFIDSNTRYFATIPLNIEMAIELSIFISFDDDGKKIYMNSPDSQSVFAHSGQIIKNNIVQLVVHPAKGRSLLSELTSEIPSLALVFEKEVYEETGQFAQEYEHHKIGGLPAFTTYREPWYSEVQKIISDGYIHIVQFSFPTLNDALFEGSWPFGNYIFHVFGKEIDGELKLLSCWK